LSLLLDENLSPRLTVRLASLFPGLTHVRDVGLKQADDRGIWDWAKQNSCTVVTADADFVAMASRAGPPPKVVHIERCDFPLQVIEELLRQNAIRISEFEKDSNSGLLVLSLPLAKPIQ
jgi:predicted nuclease of predicted toxin-antitoxin system